MKEIKAYVRREKAGEVVESLRRNGISRMTLLDVHAVGFGEDPDFCAPLQELFTRYHQHVVKLELVCNEQQVEPLIDTIEQAAHTGFEGDGLIFVSNVGTAVRIRDGATGNSALKS